jgi:hypothetical protein
MRSPNQKNHNIIEAEAFTGQPANCRWTEMPSMIKKSGDDAYLRGINRFVLHTCPLQPWGDDVKPGVTMGRWGTHFGRTQTWAETGKPMFDYMARSQALLQWGEPSKEKLPINAHYISRTANGRTVFFIVNRSDKYIPFAIRGKWYNPVTGKITKAPAKLAPNESGFFEKDEAFGVMAEMKESRIALTSFTPQLGDWTLSSDKDTKYFSGTKTYHASFEVAKKYKTIKISFPEHKDQVYTVRVNGHKVGTAWCSPWEVELPLEVLSEKANRLEIDVTNCWANRLIGDESEVADCEYLKAPMSGGEVLKCYPKWFAYGISKRPSKGRQAFVTWNYFSKDDKLIPSGLTKVDLICFE